MTDSIGFWLFVGLIIFLTWSMSLEKIGSLVREIVGDPYYLWSSIIGIIIIGIVVWRATHKAGERTRIEQEKNKAELLFSVGLILSDDGIPTSRAKKEKHGYYRKHPGLDLYHNCFTYIIANNNGDIPGMAPSVSLTQTLDQMREAHLDITNAWIIGEFNFTMTFKNKGKTEAKDFTYACKITTQDGKIIANYPNKTPVSDIDIGEEKTFYYKLRFRLDEDGVPSKIILEANITYSDIYGKEHKNTHFGTWDKDKDFITLSP